MRPLRWSAAALAAASALAASVAVLGLPTSAAAPAGPCGVPAKRPWCNTKLSPDQRAAFLLAALTPDERISLLAGAPSDGHTGESFAVDRVGLPAVYFTDGPKGIQQGSATALPIPLALAATWDRGMAVQHGAVIGRETKYKGNDVQLGPTVNIMRTPLDGRTFESYGEDPYLASRLGVGWIRGAQSQGVIADVKHYCCNNQEGAPAIPPVPGFLGSKYFASSDIDERTLREIYLPAFEAAIREANAGSVMCAYNRVNGPWACESAHLLNEILKGDWGFKGFVVSDWDWATHNTVDAAKNGLDLEMPRGISYNRNAVKAALASGLVTQADVDEHVRRFLRTLFAFGFFDRAAYRNDDRQIDRKGHARTAEVMEESAITLLENRGALPLDARNLSSIALIGGGADRFETGGGTHDVTPFSFTTPRQAIIKRAGPNVKVTYDDGSNAQRAATVARSAGVAVVFAFDWEGEDKEKQCMSLTCPSNGDGSDQDGLIEAVAAANPNTIVILETGAPVLTPWRGRVKGLLEAWYPGQEGGTAIARVLFGDVDPGGRLPVTFPAQESDIPTAGDPLRYPGVASVTYSEGVFVGYRHYDAKGIEPAYPFGFGLSYTTFRYDDLRIESGGAGAAATVSARVTNTGRRAGWAVPQLYLGLPSPSASVLQPPRALKGFAKLSLKPGKAARASFALDDRAFSYWDSTANSWRVAPGCYRVMVGSSSRDLPLRGVISRGGASCGSGAVVLGKRVAAEPSAKEPLPATGMTGGTPIGVALVLLGLLLAVALMRASGKRVREGR